MLEDFVGQSIRLKRGELHMTLEDLSFLCGIEAAHLGKIERGQHNPSLATVDRIAEALGLNLSELIQGNSEENIEMLNRFVKNMFPPLTGLKDYDPLRLLDFLGQIMLDKLTLRDLERGAYGNALFAKFKLIKRYLEDEENGRYIAYGIEGRFEGGNVLRVENVSCDVRRITKLVNTCNRIQLSKEHFLDVVEDFVQDYPGPPGEEIAG